MGQDFPMISVQSSGSFLKTFPRIPKNTSTSLARLLWCFCMSAFIDLPVRKKRATLKCISKVGSQRWYPQAILEYSEMLLTQHSDRPPFLIDFVKIELRAWQAELDKVSTVKFKSKNSLNVVPIYFWWCTSVCPTACPPTSLFQLATGCSIMKVQLFAYIGLGSTL